MLGVFFRYFKDKYKSVLAFSISAVAFLEMYVALYPSIQETSAQLNELIKTYPDAFFKAFGMDKSELAFTTVESYLATEQFSFMWPILAIILAASLANAIAINDIDKGTSEFVLAQPISRLKLFLSRYFAGLLFLGFFVGVSIYGAIPLFKIHEITYNIARYHDIALICMLFITAVYSLATFFSVIVSDKGKAGFMTGGTILLMYVINIISTLKDNLVNLKYASIFYYFSAAKVLSKGEIVDYAIPVLLIFSILVTIGAIVWFDRRDVAV